MTDRIAGTNLRASVADSTGSQANGSSEDPSISSDGRLVAFDSYATNLVTGDTNARADVFVYDQAEETTTRISVSSSGAQATGTSAAAAISADGRYVAFQSDAPNLVSGDTNGRTDIFVRDLVNGTTTRLSVSSTGAQANDSSYSPSISSDGRYIAFESVASNLVSGDTNGVGDVLIRDQQTGTTSRASVSSSGAQGNGMSEQAAISGDASSVAFSSYATNLVASDTNGQLDVFVRKLTTGQTALVSVDATGQYQGNKASYVPTISSDGRYVAFQSDATTIFPNDTNGVSDIYERDVAMNSMSRLSVGTYQVPDVQANGASSYPAISGDGLWVVFPSVASNLIASDTSVSDVFTHEWVEGRTKCDTEEKSDTKPVPPWIPFGQQPPTYDERCQDAVPDGSDPYPGSEKFGLFDSFSAIDPRSGGQVTIKLWRGRVSPITLLGWGYRHIYAKHGWSSQIRGDIANALSNPSVYVIEPPNVVDYYWYYTRGGNPCTRKVVVDFTLQEWEPEPKDVITSYAYYGQHT